MLRITLTNVVTLQIEIMESFFSADGISRLFFHFQEPEMEKETGKTTFFVRFLARFRFFINIYMYTYNQTSLSDRRAIATGS